MTATLTTPTDAWRWWEARRLRYNIVLFVVGWIGFALLVTLASGFAPLSLQSLGVADALGVIIRLGTIYLLYMVAANLLFLLGPVLESLIKPEPVQAYRRRAWSMGLLVSAALPLIAAVNLGLLLWDPWHGG